MRLQKFGKKIKETGTGRNRLPSRLQKGISKGPQVRTSSPFGRSYSTSVTPSNIRTVEDDAEAQAAGHTGERAQCNDAGRAETVRPLPRHVALDEALHLSVLQCLHL